MAPPLLFLFAGLFAGPQQRGWLALGCGVIRGLFLRRLGRILLLGLVGLLPLFLDGRHLGVDGLLLRLLALLHLAAAFAQVLLGQIQTVGRGLDGLRERKLVTLQILGPAFR